MHGCSFARLRYMQFRRPRFLLSLVHLNQTRLYDLWQSEMGTCTIVGLVQEWPFLQTNTISSRKYALRQKWGGGIYWNIQFVSCIRPLPRKNTCEVDNHDDCPSFLEEWQLRWTYTYGKSAALVLILCREASKQLAPLVVIGGNPA